MTASLQPKGEQPKPLRNSNVSGRLGTLTTRLAENTYEVRQAQHIRYKVFCEELNARPGFWSRLTRRDEDHFDDICDHLLMLDGDTVNAPKIVGTQRFHVGGTETGPGSYYSSGEFEVSKLVKRHPKKRFMELGRSCILPEYRDRRTMELLWHGTWQYALQKNADVMFGCASFHTTDPDEISEELGFLASINIGGEWHVDSARKDRIELSEFQCSSINPKSVIRKLPPLLKGYLRLGAGFSSFAVKDREFGTIDILVVLPLSAINPRYIAHYGSDATRHNR